LTLDHDGQAIEVWHETDEETTDTTDQTLTVDDDHVVDVTVTQDPETMNYIEGEELDLTGLEVEVEWEVEGTETLTWPEDSDELLADPPDGTTLTLDHDGQAIEVWHESDEETTDTTDQTLTVDDDHVVDVTVTQDPDTMIYIEGEELDLTGLEVEVEWEVEGTETLTWPEDSDELVADPADGTTLTLDHDGQAIEVWHETDEETTDTTDQTLTVDDDYVVDVTVTQDPETMNYIEGEELDLTGLEVEVEWEIEGTETLTWPEDSDELVADPADGTTLTLDHDGQAIEVWHESDEETTDTTDQTLTVDDDYVVNVEVIEDPDQMSYIEGEELDLAGSEVEVEWKVADTETLSWPDDSDDLETDPSDGTTLTLDHDGQSIEVWHESDEEITDTTDQKLTVDDDYVVNVEVIEDPDQMNYIEGEELDLTGLTVEVEWDVDGIETLTWPEEEDVLVADPVEGTVLELEDDGETIEVWHVDREDETVIDETDPLSVEDDYIVDVTVTQDPDTMEYVEGEELDLTGLTVDVELEVAGTETMTWVENSDELETDPAHGIELTLDHDGTTIEVWHVDKEDELDETSPLTVEEPERYNVVLGALIGEGSVEVGEEELEEEDTSIKIESGTTVTISANPAEGWRFEEWGGDAIDERDENFEITIEDDYDIEVTFIELAYFEVEIIGYSENVVEGEELNVTVEVNNSGGEEAAQTIELFDFDNEVVDDKEISLYPEEDPVKIDLTWNTDKGAESGDGDAGTGDLKVGSDDDIDSFEAKILTRPYFLIEEIEIEDDVVVDQETDVNVTIENKGEAEATQKISVMIFVEEEESILAEFDPVSEPLSEISKNVTLSGEEKSEAIFPWTPEEPGEYEAAVATEDDTASIPSLIEVDDPKEEEEEDTDSFFSVDRETFLPSLAVLLVIPLIGVFLVIRKSPSIVQVKAPKDRIENVRGKRYIYQFTLDRSGKGEETFDLEARSSNKGWRVAIPTDEISISGDSEVSIPVKVFIPREVEHEEKSKIMLSAVSKEDNDVSDYDYNRVVYRSIETELESSHEEKIAKGKRSETVDEGVKEEELEEEEQEEEAEEEAEELTKEEAIEELSQIKGIGKSKAELLYENGYSSLDDLKKASKEDLKDVKGIGPTLSEMIIKSVED